MRLTIGDKSVRADSVLYDASLHARMIVEYKAPHIPITQKVFDQISVYNLLLHVDYLVVSNGMQTYICKMDYAHQKVFIPGGHSRLYRYLIIIDNPGPSFSPS